MERLITLSQLTRAWPIWLRYSVTAVLAGLALAASLALGTGSQSYPFVLFYPVIVFVGLVFDRGSGFFATALGTALILYFVLPPRGSFEVGSAADLLALVLFAASAVLIAMVIEIAHVLLHRLQTAERELKMSIEEMSHRTRNNMQLLASMLSLESRAGGQSADEVVRSAIERIRAFGRIHNRLFAKSRHGTIDAAQFLGDLCADLQAGLIGSQLVTIRTELEPIGMRLSEATTLGLLVNELVTNAMKHAFEGRAAGIVTVALRKEDGRRMLSVADDGTGMREAAATGFGMHVVRTLVSQIEGELDVTTAPGDGTTFVVRFR